MSELLNSKVNLEPCHIRMARSGLDLTVRELAVLSDVNKATIVRIEAGYPVRNSTMNSIVQTLEEQGARFELCNQTNDVLVGVKSSLMKKAG